MACPFAGGSSVRFTDPNNDEEAAQAGINKVELGQGVTYSQYLQVRHGWSQGATNVLPTMG